MTREDRGSRKKAIRLKCLDCCCGSAYEVRLCPVRKCPLWRFRLGAECRDESAENTEDSQETCSDESQPSGQEVPNEHDDFKGVEHLQKPQWGTAQIVCGW